MGVSCKTCSLKTQMWLLEDTDVGTAVFVVA